MIKHSEFFNRAMEEGDYAAVMTIEDAVEKDLESSNNEFNKALEAWAQIEEYSIEKLEAENVFHRVQIEYNEKRIAHLQFIEG